MFIAGVWVWLSALSEEVHVPHPILPDPSDSLLKVNILLKSKNHMSRKNKMWIQRAVKHEGRVRTYLRRTYGNKAFNTDGTIKISYLKKAIQELKSRPASKRPPGLLNALYLALRLKKMKK